MTETTTLIPTDISTNGGTQPRASLDQPTVDRYTQDMKDGDTFPPIDVYYDGRFYWLADGFHRLQAHNAAFGRRKPIPTSLHQGTQRDAILHSVRANAAHGLPRTDDDKRRAVRRLLTDDEWKDWSDREIARRCKVSPTFVGKLRSSLQETLTVHVDSEPPTERTYIDRYGEKRTMQTANIGVRPPDPIKTRLQRHEANQGQTPIDIDNLRARVLRYIKTYTDSKGRTFDELENPSHTNGIFWTDITNYFDQDGVPYNESTLKFAIKQLAAKVHQDAEFRVEPGAQGPQVREALERWAKSQPSSYKSIIRMLADKEASGYQYKMNQAIEALGTSEMFIWHQAMILHSNLPNEPIGNWQTDLLNRLHSALHSYDESNETWDERRQHGLNDSQLRQAISYEFGITGGLSGPGQTRVAYTGGSNPTFTYDVDGPNEIELAGNQLLQRARKVLDMPYPEPEEEQKPEHQYAAIYQLETKLRWLLEKGTPDRTPNQWQHLLTQCKENGKTTPAFGEIYNHIRAIATFRKNDLWQACMNVYDQDRQKYTFTTDSPTATAVPSETPSNPSIPADTTESNDKDPEPDPRNADPRTATLRAINRQLTGLIIATDAKTEKNIIYALTQATLQIEEAIDLIKQN